MKKVFKFMAQIPYGSGFMYIAADTIEKAIYICSLQKPPTYDGQWDTIHFEEMKWTVNSEKDEVLDFETWSE